MRKRTKVTFSVILVVCLLLSGLPSAAPVAATEVDEPLTSPIIESAATETQEVTEQAAAVTEEIPVLQLDADCQILNHVDPEVFAAGNHIARLPEQETLSSYVFLNADGSQTVYYMDQPVKFEKADGTVVEKNLTLTAATEGYTTTQNDIQLTIPTSPTNGIRLVYDYHQITLIPQGGTLTNAAQATDSSVTYPDYYGEGMSLRYTPTLSGVKEDILLDAYSGVNSFTFRLNTGGLNLYQANGRYFLAESKAATDRIELGEVVTYDAKSKFSIGTMTAQTIMPGQAYMLTLTVDEAFLTNENTTYPVTIDPTLTISYGNNGSNYIIDAPIFEGYPNNNYGAFQYNRVGYVDSSYQSGRTVVKLPVLTSSSIYTSLTAANITSVKFHVKEATGSSGISVSLYPLTSNSTWTETNVTWNNVGSRASTATDTKTLTDSAWSAFDITALVKQWKSGAQNANRGFIMIGANENSLDKSFCSSEHEKTSYRPYVVMTYTSDISLNKTIADVDKGSTLTLTATTSPAGQAVTWSSSNTSVATVNNSGRVTGVAYGSATITATKADGTSASCLVYVTITDGVYRIQNSNNGLYLGTYGNIAENTSVKLLGYSNTGLSKIRQLWKIAYIGSGYYSIRPMHKLDMGLHATSNNVDITTTSGPNNTLNDVVSYNRWGISFTGTEGIYYINNIGTSSMALRSADGAASPGLGVITAVNNGSSSTFRWELEIVTEAINGVILYDTSTNYAASNPTRYVTVGEAKTLSDFNLLPVRYSSSNDYTELTWTAESSCISVNESTGAITSLSISDGPVEIVGASDYGTVNFTIYVVLPEGVYFIRSRAYNRYIQLNNSNASSGASIEQWTYHGEDYQKWAISWRGNGYYSIISVQNGMALTVPLGQTESTEVSLVQEEYTGTDRQLWKITAINEGRYKIKAKSAEGNATDLVMTAGHGTLNDSNAVNIEQCQYTNDEKYNDEWFICSIVDVGMSTDDYTYAPEELERDLGSYLYANAFYNQLTGFTDTAPFTLTHRYNSETIHTASKTDFAVNGAISENIDFMVCLGHGHVAHCAQNAQNSECPWGNHVQYCRSAIVDDEFLTEYTDVCENGSRTQAEKDRFCLYTSEVRFGSSTSDLRWVWMYTCNFLHAKEDNDDNDGNTTNDNDHVKNADLIKMMTGAHMVMGYASRATLCKSMANTFATYLRNGDTVYDAYFKAGHTGEASIAPENHYQKILYIPQAKNETIYSPAIYYEYDVADVRVAKRCIQDVY